MAKPVTATDVAHAAGVSQATVSYVINNHPGHRIAPETRERVLRAVDELGYTPSAAARALRRGSSDIALLVLPDGPFGPTLASLVEELAEELGPSGLELLTRRVGRSGRSAAPWRDIRPAVVLSFLTTLTPADEAELRAAGIPIVGAMLTPVLDADAVGATQIVVGSLQVEHLVTRGHHVLGYAAPDDPRVRAFFDLRLEGVRLACLELSLDEPVVITVPLDAGAAAGAVGRWRSRPKPVTAICAYNDEIAFAVLAGMHRLGLRAPQDLAVIGVDDIPLAPLANPPLTTIDQHQGLIARHLARRIMSAVNGTPPPPRLGPDAVSVVVRQSA